MQEACIQVEANEANAQQCYIELDSERNANVRNVEQLENQLHERQETVTQVRNAYDELQHSSRETVKQLEEHARQEIQYLETD